MSKLVNTNIGRESMRSFEEAIRREWVISNGLGGYAGSSIIGANTRKHHGLLVASLHAPTKRRVILNRIAEKVTIDGESVSFSSVQRKGKVYEEGYRYQTGFSFDAVPTFTYFYKGILVKKTIAFEREKNTVAIGYEIRNEGKDAFFSFTPVFNYRDHNEGSQKKDFSFMTKAYNDLIVVKPEGSKEQILFYTDNGMIVPSSEKLLYDEDIELQTEIDTGMSSSDAGFMPYHILVSVKPKESLKLSFVCTIEKSFETDAFTTIENARTYAKGLIESAGCEDTFLKRLIVNADNFIVKRESTGGKTILAGLPWFTDWGRDTMIAFRGLVLETGRLQDARSILATFAKYERNGLIPNMFPDEGVEPLYNTVDASLWYFNCVYDYLNFDKSPEAFDFIKTKIYPCLKRIIEGYEKGTDFSIYMDRDYLICAGSDLDQVTWMDVRTDGYVVTPRHGKPVEINALWYNALKICEFLSEKYEDDFSKHCAELAEKVKASFNSRFFNEELGCLYDVVDEIKRDGVTVSDNADIRPNQIYAVSLPFTMLDVEKERAVVDCVLEKLYTDFGLRTLSRDNPDYHGRYEGKLSDRDMAYHQGTAWAFLLGGFITAYLKVYSYSKRSKAFARELLKPFESHLNDGCIGGIAEVFDGDFPHNSHGCYTQAWSVGEIIKAYKEITGGSRND